VAAGGGGARRGRPRCPGTTLCILSAHRRCQSSVRRSVVAVQSRTNFPRYLQISSAFAAQCVRYRVCCARTGAICLGDVVVLSMDVQPATGSVHGGTGRQQAAQQVPGRGKSRRCCQASPQSAAARRGASHFSTGHATAGHHRTVAYPIARDNAVGVTLRMYLLVLH